MYVHWANLFGWGSHSETSRGKRILTLVLRETLVIWDVTPCVLVYVYRLIRVTSVRIGEHGSEVRTRDIPNTKTVRRQDVRTSAWTVLILITACAEEGCKIFLILYNEPTNAQLFHKLLHCYMFRHCRVTLGQPAINTLPSHTSISNAAVGNTV